MIEAIRSTHINHMLRSELQLGFENLTTTGGIRAEEEVGTPWTVAVAQMEDLVGEEAPSISMDFEGWRSSRTRK
jgi:hypothetical protein